MSRFELWFIRGVFIRLLRQGPHHHRNVELLYRLIREIRSAEFSEDNDATHDTMLREAFESTQWRMK